LGSDKNNQTMSTLIFQPNHELLLPLRGKANLFGSGSHLWKSDQGGGVLARLWDSITYQMKSNSGTTFHSRGDLIERFEGPNQSERVTISPKFPANVAPSPKNIIITSSDTPEAFSKIDETKARQFLEKIIINAQNQGIIQFDSKSLFDQIIQIANRHSVSFFVANPSKISSSTVEQISSIISPKS